MRRPPEDLADRASRTGSVITHRSPLPARRFGARRQGRHLNSHTGIMTRRYTDLRNAFARSRSSGRLIGRWSIDPPTTETATTVAGDRSWHSWQRPPRTTNRHNRLIRNRPRTVPQGDENPDPGRGCPEVGGQITDSRTGPITSPGPARPGWSRHRVAREPGSRIGQAPAVLMDRCRWHPAGNVQAHDHGPERRTGPDVRLPMLLDGMIG